MEHVVASLQQKFVMVEKIEAQNRKLDFGYQEN